jgi:hypothetical protein
MIQRALLALPVVAAIPSLAHAQACASMPFTVKVQCKAELLAMSGATKALEAGTPPARLSMQAVGKQATVPMGDYSLSAGLACSSGRGDSNMAYALEVRLSQKGRPHASPLHLAMLRNLALDGRAGKPPLTIESYYFFEPALTLADAKFTRLDYSCWIETKG